VSSSSEYTETIICNTSLQSHDSSFPSQLILTCLPLLLFSLSFPFLAKCIDRYIKLRVEQFEGVATGPIDSRLESIARRMFKRCFEDGEYKQVCV